MEPPTSNKQTSGDPARAQDLVVVETALFHLHVYRTVRANRGSRQEWELFRTVARPEATKPDSNCGARQRWGVRTCVPAPAVSLPDVRTTTR
jgi:hypothetical protein